MQSVYISTTYLGPVQQYCKLFQYPEIHLETAENYLKQTFRNRCTIAAANGPLALSVPIVKPDTLKCPTKDIRISDHGNWRHLHWNALVSAYYEKKYEFLFDYNEELRQLICRLLDLHPNVIYTEEYQPEVPNDFREIIRPKHEGEDPSFSPKPYYQVFQDKHGFLPNMSIVDLLFNMGPEGLLVLRDSIVAPEQP